MKRRILYLLSVVFASCCLLSACKDDSYLASDDWKGRWRMGEEIEFPQTKTSLNAAKTLPEGTITIDDSDERTLHISGDLFGLYSTLIINATATSTSANFDQTIGIYKLKGTVNLTSSTQTKWSFTITTENSNTKAYSITATKVSK